MNIMHWSWCASAKGEPCDCPVQFKEKEPERKWPEDFRGFGSNVAPRKRKKG